MANTRILEPSALARLRHVGGDALVWKLGSIFLEQAPLRVESAREGLRSGDISAVERAAHSLKSSAWNLGMTELGGIAAELEQMAGSGKTQGLGELLYRMEAAYVAAQEELMREVPGLGSKSTVAVIEDNADNRVLVGAILEGIYETKGYSNGPEALEAMRRNPPSLVLLDVSLPVMDGLEVLARMRKDPKLKSIPVIALTAHTMAGDKEYFLGAGFDDYISKPIVDPDHLISTIRALLETSGEGAKT